MKRRTFLGLLGTGAAGFALDPERMLWIPGQKSIFLPPKQLTIGAPFYIEGGAYHLFDDAAWEKGKQVHGMVSAYDGWTPRVSGPREAWRASGTSDQSLRRGFVSATWDVKAEQFVPVGA